jgi:16S rRNA (guanine527-N7)-methyltransferase
MTPPDIQNETLEAYARALFEWNQSIRLTGYRTLNKIRENLIDESVLVSRHFRVSEQSFPIVDFGSGNGAPGVVFAILNPDLPVALVDRKSKKRSFLVYLVGLLDLKCVSIFSDLNEAIDHFSNNNEIALWMKGISVESLQDALKYRKTALPLQIHIYKFGSLDQNNDCNRIRLHVIKCPDENKKPFKRVEISECDYRPRMK